MNVVLLFRSLPIEKIGHNGEHHVGCPCREHRWCAGIDGKRGRNGLEHDVAETQGQTETQIEPHAALALARREREADDREDERGEGGGNALVVFHLILHHVARSAVDLLGDVFAQFGTGECLLLAFGIDKVGRLHEDDRVFLGTAGDVLLESLQLALLPVAHTPVELGVGDGVILHLHSREVAHELLVLKLVEFEAVALLRVVVVVLDVGYHAFVHLQLHIVGRCVLGVVAVECLEILAYHRAVGYLVGPEIVGEGGDKHTRNHVGAHETLEGDAGGQHGDDLRVAGQLGGEEDDGDEDEKRTEKIGVVGDEVGIVIEDDGSPRGMILRELGEILVEVEDYGNGDDQGNGEEIGADELLDDIPVQNLDITLGIQEAQEAKVFPQPPEQGLKAGEQSGQLPVATVKRTPGAEKSAMLSDFLYFHLCRNRFTLCAPVGR